MQKMPIPDEIKTKMQRLLDAGFEANLIGGCVRDFLFGLKPKDYDIFTNSEGEQILKLLPEGKIIGNEERQEKILTVVVDGTEISQYRRNGERTETGTSLAEHLSTCDLTINAIACDINGNILNSTLDKVDDVYNKRLRFVGSPYDRIMEDPLRIMRALRFMLKHDLMMDDQTEETLRKQFNKLTELPPERIRDEMLKIIAYPDGVNLLNFFGFFKLFIPELTALKGIECGDYHNEDIYDHSRMAFETACTVTDNVILRFAILLHDIGKAPAFKKTDDKITFYEHEDIGAEIAKDIMTRLKFSSNEIKYATAIIKNHMVGYVGEMKDSTVAKLFGRLQENGIHLYDYIIEKYCDHQANLTHERVKFGDFLKGYPLLKRIREIEKKKVPLAITDLEINGHDVMNFGVKGKDVGDVLKQAFSRVMSGELDNRRDKLMEWARWFIRDNYWTS